MLFVVEKHQTPQNTSVFKIKYFNICFNDCICTFAFKSTKTLGGQSPEPLLRDKSLRTLARIKNLF